MKLMHSLVLVFFLVVTSACSNLALQAEPKADHYNREYQIGSYLWFQTSGEFRALCYQAYNLAKMKLDRDLENKHNKKRAVVLDIDETVLDNSFGGALEIQKRESWNKDLFNRWVKQRAAGAIPGAREFLKYAQSRQVEIIYISNRHTDQKMDTYENLKRLDFPVKMDNFYFSNNEWSKELRRQEVLKKYHIVLYFGDSLGDFHQDWDDKQSEKRRSLVDSHRDEFGEKFIIFPNPLYGEWENSLPENINKSDLLKTAP